MAERLFAWAQTLRRPDGRYLTGIAYPQEVSFPDGEHTTYTAAAVILAADALSGSSPASGLFIDHRGLPAIIDVEKKLYEAAHARDITSVTISQRLALEEFHAQELRLGDANGDDGWALRTIDQPESTRINQNKLFSQIIP